MGIEPTSSAWKAEVLPLNYTRSCWPLQPLAGSHFTAMIVALCRIPPEDSDNLVEGGGLLHAFGIPPSGPSRPRDVQSRFAALVEPLEVLTLPRTSRSGEDNRL